MVQSIEVFRQVQCYRMGISLLCILFHLLNSVFRTSSRTITVTVLREQRLVGRCKALCYRLLENAVLLRLEYQAFVFHRPAWESPLVSPGQGCTFPIFILSISSFWIFPQVCAYFFHGNPVDSWRSLVCLHPL